MVRLEKGLKNLVLGVSLIPTLLGITQEAIVDRIKDKPLERGNEIRVEIKEKQHTNTLESIVLANQIDYSYLKDDIRRYKRILSREFFLPMIWQGEVPQKPDWWDRTSGAHTFLYYIHFLGKSQRLAGGYVDEGAKYKAVEIPSKKPYFETAGLYVVMELDPMIYIQEVDRQPERIDREDLIARLKKNFRVEVINSIVFEDWLDDKSFQYRPRIERNGRLVLKDRDDLIQQICNSVKLLTRVNDNVVYYYLLTSYKHPFLRVLGNTMFADPYSGAMFARIHEI
ncbi:MAG: hypothetical protein QW524_02860, partial [Candidatus Woesearchaeota archaeon]